MQPEPLNNFTYAEYATLVGGLLADRQNLCFRDFRRPVAAERFVILRHDVDLCPTRALAMARAEAEAGFHATYFFLLTSPCYNLLSARFLHVPREIAELGHEVGLHYDVTVLEGVRPDRQPDLLGQQADALGRITGRAVRSIAMHQPAYSGTDPFRSQATYVNAYEPRFTSQIDYLSDSCGAWRDEAHAVLTGPAEQAPSRIQLLTHPLYWAPQPGTRWDRLAGWIADRRHQVDEDVRGLEEIWRAHTGAAEHNARHGLADPPEPLRDCSK